MSTKLKSHSLAAIRDRFDPYAITPGSTFEFLEVKSAFLGLRGMRGIAGYFSTLLLFLSLTLFSRSKKHYPQLPAITRITRIS